LKRSVLRKVYRVVSTGAAYDDVAADRVDPGELWRIESISAENETSNFTELRIYIKGHGYEHWLYEKENPLGGKLYWSEEDITLGEGEQIIARFSGCTSGDKLAFYLNGYREEV